mgnify:CR=1 FL=1
MSLTKVERIIRLKRGIISSETPDALKKVMEADLEELLKPEPVYTPPPPKPKPRPYKKKVIIPVKEVPIIVIPPPPQRTFTADEKEAIIEGYARRRARKKAREE